MGCDILERPGDSLWGPSGESDNDFLFMADIQALGTGKELKAQDAVTQDRCIFQDVMYDIQKFTPGDTDDGKLDLTLHSATILQRDEKLPMAGLSSRAWFLLQKEDSRARF